MKLRFASGLLFFGIGNGDTYLHNPKGCNNRLNEQSANRNNANRLFDSQNNNRGGYNVADLDDQNGFQDNNNYQADFDAMYDVTEDVGQQQYNMVYQEGSVLRMTWTAQHGCGNAMNNCNFVIQFICDDQDYEDDNFNTLDNVATGTRAQLKNGGNTGGLTDPGTDVNNIANTYNTNNNNRVGRHESEEFYSMCRNRNRDEGLFTADQNLKGNAQRNTRQNPNGNKSGLECPEERDYYPWGYPTPWRDIVWKGNDVEYCKTDIAPNSQNVKPKGTCIDDNDTDELPTQDQIQANNEAECTAAGGDWFTTDWGQTDNEAFRDQLCQEQQWSSVNHLGNVDGTAKGGQMDSYEWTIPSFAELTGDFGCHAYSESNTNGDHPWVGSTGGNQQQFARLAVRLRYNISTTDYDPYETDASQNNDPANGVISPIQQNPTVDVGAYMQGLRLAINTAQTGRTFQDRTHVFVVAAKPNLGAASGAAAAQVSNNQAMLNVNVRGKRGNIVQTFPAVEYDFEPNDLAVQQGQCLHFQWAGSNTHNNGNPAGDGQAGDAGEGRGGSDRSNIMEMLDMRSSFPQAYDQSASFFDAATCKYPLSDETVSALDAKIILASAGYFTDAQDAADGGGQNNQNLDPLLNNVSGAFRQGLVCCVTENTPAGDYYFVSTRNNNFSNRSQKMHIVVKEANANEAAFEFFEAEMQGPPTEVVNQVPNYN